MCNNEHESILISAAAAEVNVLNDKRSLGDWAPNVAELPDHRTHLKLFAPLCWFVFKILNLDLKTVHSYLKEIRVWVKDEVYDFNAHSCG